MSLRCRADPTVSLHTGQQSSSQYVWMLHMSVDRMHLTVSGFIQARADVEYSNTIVIFLEVCLQPVQCLLFLSSCLPYFHKQTAKQCFLPLKTDIHPHHWRTEVGGGCSNTPPPTKFRRPSKIVPNSTRLWKLLKITEFRTPTPQDVLKKGGKILKTTAGSQLFYISNDK